MTDDGVFHIIKGGVAYEVEQDEDGSYVVSVPSLPGCMTVGDTLDEAMTFIAEAIEVWVESAIDRGIPVPKQFELRRAS